MTDAERKLIIEMLKLMEGLKGKFHALLNRKT